LLREIITVSDNKNIHLKKERLYENRFRRMGERIRQKKEKTLKISHNAVIFAKWVAISVRSREKRRAFAVSFLATAPQCRRDPNSPSVSEGVAEGRGSNTKHQNSL